MTTHPRDFELLDSVEKLACLAQEHRLAILGELVSAPRTGGQVAKTLGMRTPLVHYHLQKLVESGLAREVEVGDEEKGRRSERYFRAHARHLFVDPSLACRDDATARRLVASFERVLDAYQRREVLRVDLGAVARRVLVDGLGLAGGERLLLLGHPQSREMLEHLFVEAEALGARARMRPWSREYVIARLDRFDAQALQRAAFMPAAEFADLDAVVFVSSTQPAGSEPDAEQREKLPHLVRAIGEWQLALREQGVRYVEISIPARGDFENFGSDPAEGAALFWSALEMSPERLESAAERLIARLDAAARPDGSCAIELVDAFGSRLHLEVDARRPYRNLGRLRPEDARAGRLADFFPAGSVSFLPLEGSGEGELHAPYVSPGPRGMRDLVMRVERGRLVDVRGEGAAELLERLAHATGDAALLGELCIGLNPVGAALTGKSSLDGVLAGTITPSFGSNEVVGGTHRANLDLRFPSRELDLVVDGEVLVQRGELRV